ncbi:universal stress protein [Mucilaginibacter ximonensis]|uniref:Universal stress protein n=1 Tax=Mucilaginibacter ximonensis TaxID=538021 RepID=A0ABW5YC76_9SPHI
METILIATDFSKSAENATIYGLTLAKALKLDCKLFHADNDAADEPASNGQLSRLVKRLTKKDTQPVEGKFTPLIKFTSHTGPLAEVANALSEERSAAMIILGTSGAGEQRSAFSGRGSRQLIAGSKVPLLLVPPVAQKHLPQTIALVTSLNEADIPVVYSVATLALDLHAEIIIVHIDSGSGDHETHKNQLHKFLEKVREEIRFTAFSYRNIESKNIASELSRFTAESLTGMLAMSHGRYQQLESLLKEENTYVMEMARQLRIPLLIYPNRPGKSGYPVY